MGSLATEVHDSLPFTSWNTVKPTEYMNKSNGTKLSVPSHVHPRLSQGKSKNRLGSLQSTYWVFLTRFRSGKWQDSIFSDHAGMPSL